MVERLPEAVRLTPADTQPFESLYVYLIPGGPTAGSLAQELARAWADLVATLGGQPMRSVNGGTFDADEPGRSDFGWEYQRARGGFRAGGGGYAMDLYLIHTGDRTEQVLAVAGEFLEGGLTTMNPLQNPRYERAVREMVYSLRFANLPQIDHALPGLRGGGIAGVWAGLSMSFGALKPHVAALFDDGTAFFGPNPPARGLSQVDPAVERPSYPRYWGRYDFQGGSGVLRMPYGTVTMRTDGATLVLTVNGTEHRFARSTSPPTSAFEGTWCLRGGQCLRLLAGGRFEDRGAVRAAEHAVYAVPESPTGGRGTFEVRDHTLVLRYEGGPEVRVAILTVPTADPANPREILLGFHLELLNRS
jgi:hypothetical protein